MGYWSHAPQKNDGWTRKGWFVVVERNTESFASNACVWLLFSRVYIYVYVICIHIYSIYWIDHPLTNTSTWRASKRDCPYSKYIYIYNDMYIYIIVILDGDGLYHTGWTQGVSHSLEACRVISPSNLAFFFMRQLYSNLPHLDSQKGGKPRVQRKRKQPAETGWVSRGRFFRWNLGWGYETLGLTGKLGSKWGQGFDPVSF